jgi:SAM-dependent methyltransferase
MWYFAGAGDVSRLLPAAGQVVLYESDTGLYFFHPRFAGDEDFYTRFYSVHGAHSLISARPHGRVEYQFASKHVPSGALVLDVGCGNGELGEHLPHCHYRGLDPYAGSSASPAVLRETLEQHLPSAHGIYDVVTAFQVIEHVADPRAFTSQLVELLKPGGTLIIGAPLHPSPLTEIPNLLINAPPHHLTWWNSSAFAALVATLGLSPIEISEVGYSPHEAIIYWMHRLTLVRPGTDGDERYFAHRWVWHLNLILSYLLGRMINRLLPPPASGRPCNVILIARKPIIPSTVLNVLDSTLKSVA